MPTEPRCILASRSSWQGEAILEFQEKLRLITVGSISRVISLMMRREWFSHSRSKCLITTELRMANPGLKAPEAIRLTRRRFQQGATFFVWKASGKDGSSLHR